MSMSISRFEALSARLALTILSARLAHQHGAEAYWKTHHSRLHGLMARRLSL